MTKTEAELLDKLSVFELKDLQGIKGDAFSTADREYPAANNAEQNDSHNDAFRHTYWNALMTKKFGQEWTEAFTTAHEGVPGNDPTRGAMDLYNNQVGRQIASEHPDADDDELAELVRQAVVDGKVLVLDQDGQLAYSDTVEVGRTGHPVPGGQPLPGRLQPDPGANPDS